MSLLQEQRAVRAWIYTRLTGAAGVMALVSTLDTTRIYPGVAEEGAATPYLVYQLHSGRVHNSAGADNRNFTEPLFLLKAIGEISGTGDAPDTADLADQAASAMDAALRGVIGTQVVDGQTYRIMHCYQERPLEYYERPAAGRTLVHIGALYRFGVYLGS